MSAPTFDFSRFLSSEEQQALGRLDQWKWVSSFGMKEIRPTRHPRHEAWTRIKGNTYSPAHREVMLTLRGTAIYSFEGKIYLRRPGTVLLLDRHEVRDLKGSTEKKAFSCLWLHLYNSEYLTYYINSCDETGRYVHELPMRTRGGEASRQILAAWDQCKSEPANPLSQALLKSLVSSVLLEILGTCESTEPVDVHQKVVDSLKDYIGAHLGEDLSLRNLASLAGYSPFFFHRLFVRHTGKTPVQYVNAARLAHAVTLLDAGYKVEEVGLAVGFSSTSYFNHFFKKHLGAPPGIWRGKSKRSLVITD